MRIKIDEKQLKELITLGVPKTKIAEHLGISSRSLFRYLKTINKQQITEKTSKTINETKKENINVNKKTNKENHNPKKLNEMSEEERNAFLEAQLKKANENILK